MHISLLVALTEHMYPSAHYCLHSRQKKFNNQDCRNLLKPVVKCSSVTSVLSPAPALGWATGGRAVLGTLVWSLVSWLTASGVPGGWHPPSCSFFWPGFSEYFYFFPFVLVCINFLCPYSLNNSRVPTPPYLPQHVASLWSVPAVAQGEGSPEPEGWISTQLNGSSSC